MLILIRHPGTYFRINPQSSTTLQASKITRLQNMEVDFVFLFQCFFLFFFLFASYIYNMQEKQRNFRCFSCIRIIHFSYIFPYIQNLECMILHSQLQADILQFQVVCLQSSFDQMNIYRTLSTIQQTQISQ